MVNEANGNPSHNEMQQLLWRHYAKDAELVETEFPLKNGRRADLYIKYNDRVAIIEVKVEAKDSLLAEAYIKYAMSCDYLYVATGFNSYINSIAPGTSSWWVRKHDKIGLLLVTWEGIKEVRPAALLA